MRRHFDTIINICSHKLNPLHLYCRLCRILGEKTAMKLSLIYEKTLFRFVQQLVKSKIHHMVMEKENAKTQQK